MIICNTTKIQQKIGKFTILPAATEHTILTKNTKKGCFWADLTFIVKNSRFFCLNFNERRVNLVHFLAYCRTILYSFYKYIANIKINSQASNENQQLLGIYVFFEKFEKKI